MSSRSVRLKNFKTYFLKLKSDIKLHVELTSGTIIASVYLLNGKIVLKKTGEWSTKEQQRSNVKYHVLHTIIVGNKRQLAIPISELLNVLCTTGTMQPTLVWNSNKNEMIKKTTCLITCVQIFYYMKLTLHTTLKQEYFNLQSIQPHSLAFSYY